MAMPAPSDRARNAAPPATWHRAPTARRHRPVRRIAQTLPPRSSQAISETRGIGRIPSFLPPVFILESDGSRRAAEWKRWSMADFLLQMRGRIRKATREQGQNSPGEEAPELRARPAQHL